MNTSNRPVIRNLSLPDLLRYRLPLPGIVSILHRISGAFLFLFLFGLLMLLQMSLTSEAGYNALKLHVWGNPVAKLVLIGLLYFYVHHFFAGIRYLLLDLHKGIDLVSARRSSQIVVGLSLLVTLLIVVKLW